jgi:NAD-dependent deacetylase
MLISVVVTFWFTKGLKKNHYLPFMSRGQQLVVLTGAGISAESGLGTFRDAGGLWEQYPLEEVATPEGWNKNPALVTEFYNMRRKQAMEASPNAGHYALVALEERFDVHIITQNIDDLHERAGSSKVLHLHGKIREARSSLDENLIYPLDHWEIKMGQLCEKGYQLRPNVVWFGEMVPMIEPAAELMSGADLLIVTGTSLQVYPAAGLIDFASQARERYLVDPAAHEIRTSRFTTIAKTASVGLPELAAQLLAD